MLLEAIDWLAQEVIADKSVNRLAREVEKLKPGAGALVSRLYIGVAAGSTTGRTLGTLTKQNVERGMPSTVGLDYTPAIQAYDRSAIASTRII